MNQDENPKKPPKTVRKHTTPPRRPKGARLESFKKNIQQEAPPPPDTVAQVNDPTKKGGGSDAQIDDNINMQAKRYETNQIEAFSQQTEPVSNQIQESHQTILDQTQESPQTGSDQKLTEPVSIVKFPESTEIPEFEGEVGTDTTPPLRTKTEKTQNENIVLEKIMERSKLTGNLWDCLYPETGKDNPITLIMLRWEENSRNNQQLFNNPIAIGEILKNVYVNDEKFNEFVFQLEKNEKLKYYQIYLKLGTRKRPRQLTKALNKEFFNIQVRQCRDQIAGKAYCCKPEFQQNGPWLFP